MNAERHSKTAGALFTIGMAALIVIVPLYLIVYGQPEGTGTNGSVTPKDQASHLLANWEFVSRKWQLEAGAIVLLTCASLSLAIRQTHSRMAWISVTIGGLCALPMYFVMLGGYLVAAEAITQEPALYPALRGIAATTFAFGYGVIHFGLAGVFWSERLGKYLPVWLASLGALMSITASVLLFASFAGFAPFRLAGPPALVSYIVGFVLGIALWKTRNAEVS